MDPHMPEKEWVPVSIENEQSILGALLMHSGAYDKVRDTLRVDHFYEPLHRLIFENVVALVDSGKTATPLSLRPFIQDHHVANGVTVSEYLSRLAAESLPVTMLRDHAMILRDLAARRVLMDIAYDFNEPTPKNVLELAAKAIEDIDSLVAEQSSFGVKGVNMTDAMDQSLQAMSLAYQNKGKITGIASGFKDLDAKTLGFSRGDLVLLGGRPGMGKSAFIVSMARNMGLAGTKVLIISQEMSVVQLSDRMIADEMFDSGPATYFTFRSGRFSPAVFDRAKDAADRLRDAPIRIEPMGGQTVAQIAAKARQAKRRGNLDVLMIDHLQIVKASRNYTSRHHQIGEITGSLKALAKDLDIVIVLLSQLGRDVDKREDKRPLMTDLKESGDIEQDADTVIMLYRPTYYLQRRVPAENSEEFISWHAESERAKNRLELLIEKQRAGPTGTVTVFCDIESNAIRDFHDDQNQMD